MAYVGYDTRASVAARPALPARLSPPLAWGRLAAIGASLAAWAAILVTARVIF